MLFSVGVSFLSFRILEGLFAGCTHAFYLICWRIATYFFRFFQKLHIITLLTVFKARN